VAFNINFDAKKAAAFNVICSSFMMSYLDDPTILKFGNDSDKGKPKNLIEKGGLERLIMNLSGSSGSGTEF
jgi:hypothetical protein